MKALKITKEIPLPIKAVTETFAAIGRRGAGKSYLATMIAGLAVAAIFLAYYNGYQEGVHDGWWRRDFGCSMYLVVLNDCQQYPEIEHPFSPLNS